MSADPVAVCVAPNGAFWQKASLPTLPVTLDEIVSEAVRCESAGAAAIHLHVRNDDGTPTGDPAVIARTVAAVREATDLVVQTTTAGVVHGQDPAERRAALDTGTESASLTVGSINLAGEPFVCSPTFVRDMASSALESGIWLETEVFDAAMARTAALLWRDAHAAGHQQRPWFGITLGADGGGPAAGHYLDAVLRETAPGDLWMAAGVGRHYFRTAALVLGMGGHLKVGYEYSTRRPDGARADSNAVLVEDVVRLAAAVGRPPATPDELRALLSASELRTRPDNQLEKSQ